jgi:hypothetical protein
MAEFPKRVSQAARADILSEITVKAVKAKRGRWGPWTLHLVLPWPPASTRFGNSTILVPDRDRSQKFFLISILLLVVISGPALH